MPLKELAQRRTALHQKSDAQAIVGHALNDVQIGPVALVSSFGAESIILLHMVSEIAPDTAVLFIDTQMLFAETLKYQRDVAASLGLSDIRVIQPQRADLMRDDVDGLLHQIDPDACCALRKARPLQRALGKFGGWITGRKRYQNGQRAGLSLYEKADDKIRVNPLAGWDQTQVASYMAAHNLPRHPLVARGFRSLGCAPCTTKVAKGEDPRAGRWRGQAKTECGIHVHSGTAIRGAINSGDAA